MCERRRERKKERVLEKVKKEASTTMASINCAPGYNLVSPPNEGH